MVKIFCLLFYGVRRAGGKTSLTGTAIKPQGFIGFEVPRDLALLLIVVIFGAAFVYAVYQERRHKKPTAVEKRAADLLVEPNGESERDRDSE